MNGLPQKQINGPFSETEVSVYCVQICPANFISTSGASGHEQQFPYTVTGADANTGVSAACGATSSSTGPGPSTGRPAGSSGFERLAVAGRVDT
jgi:hypothetical protein